MHIRLHHVGCDFCKHVENTRILRPTPAPEELPEPCYIVRCVHCGMLYTDPRPDEASVTLLYRRYYNLAVKSAESEPLKNLVRATPWLRRLWHAYNGQYLGEVLSKISGKVLDVGCGAGDILEDLLKKGCEPYGVELNPDSVSICRRKGLNVQRGDISTVHFLDNYFDTVILWHTLEHLPSPTAALKEIHRILKPGGTLFIYSPNASGYLRRIFGKYWVAWHSPFHFYHFTPADITRLAGTCGYKTAYCRCATPEHFVSASICAFASHEMKRAALAALLCKFTRSLLFRLCIAPVFRVLDLILRDQGDCLTVELKKPE